MDKCLSYLSCMGEYFSIPLNSRGGRLPSPTLCSLAHFFFTCLLLFIIKVISLVNGSSLQSICSTN